jgi:hypothetical protein
MEAAMKVSFLISAGAFVRLGMAAMERGWQSDPDYAVRTVQRALEAADPDRDLGVLEHLAAMCAEFEETHPDAVARRIAAFFGERPPRIEVGGVEYSLGAGTAQPQLALA